MRTLGLAAVAAAILAAPAIASGPPPLTAATSLSPTWVYFGERVTARVDVLADRRRVDIGSIRLNPAFGPWQPLKSIESSSGEAGQVVRRTWSLTLVCITIPCLPRTTAVSAFPLSPVTVTARTLDGSSLRVRAGWPKVNVVGRFKPLRSPAAASDFRSQSAVPAATYRWSPTSLALLLDALGIVAVVVGFVLVGRELAHGRLRRHRPVDGRPPLDRALGLVREAKLRDAADRRRAAGLLARTLASERHGLTAAASDLAWSKPDPSADGLEELADTVENESKERT